MTYRTNFDKMKDQLTLWLLLFNLKELGFQTQRLKLQKLVYLTDVFGTILKRKTTTYTFQVYKLGPFSKEVFNDIERLVSIDVIKAKEIDVWNPHQDRSFEYEIEDYTIPKAHCILNRPAFNTIKKSVELAVQAAGYLNGEEIRRLVYSEPNYIEAKRKGFGTTINPEYTFAVRFREMSKRIASEEFGIKLNEEEVLWLYLNFMRTTQSQKMDTITD